MKKRSRIRVSAGEQELLSMLWEFKTMTLAEAHAEFVTFGSAVSYPTMQTRLNRLVDKGLAKRSDERPALYSAVATEADVAAGQIRHLLDRFGRQRLVPLVAELMSEPSLSKDELAELREMLAAAEEREQKSSGAQKR